MSRGKVFIGPAGWYYKDWVGTVYPRDKKVNSNRLGFLSRFFTCIEINTTFYRIHSSRTTESWVKKIDCYRDFLFTVKIWRGFTHGGKEDFSKKQSEAFKESLRPLKEASLLGAVLVQFPWFFRPSSQSWDKLLEIAYTFSDLPLVLEIRNRMWTDPDILEKISSLGFSFCNVDQPLARDSLGPTSIVTGSVGYVRLHGRNGYAWFNSESSVDEKYNYLYDRNEIDEWISLTKKITRKAPLTFFITNNHFKGKAVVNALEFRAILEGRRVEVPEPLVIAYPQLSKIARPDFGLFVKRDLEN